MENINGINVDISKKLGEEIAKVAIASISEEEIKAYAHRAIKDVTSKQGYYHNENSKAEKEAANLFYQEVSKQISEIVNSDEYKEMARMEAENIIKEVKEKLHDNLVNNIANQLAFHVTDPYGGLFEYKVQELVARMINNK